VWCAIAGLAFALVNRSSLLVGRTEPFDLDVNLVGARRLLGARDLYDAHASQLEGIRHVASVLRYGYQSTFNSFVGPPVVAALHAPFTGFDHTTAIVLFRVVNVLALAAAVVLVVRVLPIQSRTIGYLVAVGALGMSYPLVATLELGQIHGLVLLGLAVGIWGAVRERWTVAGIGLGVAAILKLSPALLVVYLCCRGKRQVFWPSVMTVAVMCGGSALLGRPASGVEWLLHVLPNLSGGTRFVRNQSLPAFLDRLLHGGGMVSQAPLGAVRWLGPACVLLGFFTLWRIARGRPTVAPLELAAVVLVLLVGGPLSWDHYFVWAVLPVVLLCDLRLWTLVPPFTRTMGVVAIACALGMLAVPVRELRPEGVAGRLGLPVGAGPYALAALVLLVVACVLLGALRSEHAFEFAPSRVPWGRWRTRPATRSGSAGRASTTSATSTWCCRATS
jgi:hypothetical protein